MIKVLIADDDFWAREGLKNTIEWEKHGFILCGEAEDADKAYEVYKDTNPHIIITDIRMKHTNGLDLVSKIHDENQDAEFIIMSGYSQFDYAKRAYENGSSAYLLKPVSNDELVKILLELKEKIDNKNEFARKLNLLEDELPKLKTAFYNEIINKEIDEEEILRKAEAHNIEPYESYCLINAEVSRIAISDFESATKTHDEILDSFEYLKNTIPEPVDYWEYSQFNILGIIRCSNDAPEKELLAPMQKFFYDKTGKFLTIGVSTVYDSITNLKDAYLESHEALSFKSLYGNNAIIYYENTLDKKAQPVNITNATIEDIKNAIFAVDYEKAMNISDEIFTRIKSYDHVDIKDMQNSFAEIISIIVRAVYRDKQSMMKVFSDEFHPFSYILNCGTINEIQDYFNSFINKIFENPNVYLECGYDSQVQQIIAYLMQNYTMPLSVESVASEHHLSSSHFMFIFKKATGKSFHTWLTDYRIKMATQILRNPQYKIYEVASMVGFSNPERFAKSFKKITGFTPTQYRNTQ